MAEAIAALVRSDPHDVDRIVERPKHGVLSLGKGKAREEASDDAANGQDVDENVWIYEQLRRVALDLSYPLVAMLQEQCTRQSCPELKAGEWLYLCAAHASQNEHECSAIDYIIHTLDATTALLNSARYFPSRCWCDHFVR